jgi:FAD:protein FMN transferase
MCCGPWSNSVNSASAWRALVLCSLLLLGACSDPAGKNNPIVITGATMGTTYSVKLYAAAVDVGALQTQIDDRLERINALMSTWRADSELSRFNSSREVGWFSVSPETVYVAEASAAISALSGGAFDVTVGPVVNLWGFGPERGKSEAPPDESIQQAMQRVGYRQLVIRVSPPALRKQRPDLYVDLSAIAKGFAVDELARLLDERDIGSYLVEIGGELRAGGLKPDGTAWKVAIEQPVAGERAVQGVVALRDEAIATSGDYRNFVEKDGKRYSHTINPRTGRPIEHGLASVSVITASAMYADGLATAIMVLGPEEGYRLALRESLAAQLIVASADGLRVLATPEFERYVLR